MEMTYEAVFKKAREIVNQHDPMGLICIGCPKDEYDTEIAMILKNYADAKDEDELTKIVWEVFVQCFDEKFVHPKEKYRPLARDLWNLRKRESDN